MQSTMITAPMNNYFSSFPINVFTNLQLHFTKRIPKEYQRNTMTDIIQSSLPEIHNLDQYIAYQPNSIVSKQIIKKPNGNITLFAFDKGESLTEHTSPFEALVYIVAGSLEIKVGGVPYIVSAGESILLPANISHGLNAIEQAKMLLTMIK